MAGLIPPLVTASWQRSGWSLGNAIGQLIVWQNLAEDYCLHCFLLCACDNAIMQRNAVNASHFSSSVGLFLPTHSSAKKKKSGTCRIASRGVDQLPNLTTTLGTKLSSLSGLSGLSGLSSLVKSPVSGHYRCRSSSTSPSTPRRGPAAVIRNQWVPRVRTADSFQNKSKSTSPSQIQPSNETKYPESRISSNLAQTFSMA